VTPHSGRKSPYSSWSFNRKETPEREHRPERLATAWRVEYVLVYDPVLNDEGSSHPVDPAATGREHCFRPPCSHWNDPPVSMSSAAAPGGAGSATTTAPQLHEVFGVSRSSLGLLDRTRG
jgi:hypothetical protein